MSHHTNEQKNPSSLLSEMEKFASKAEHLFTCRHFEKALQLSNKILSSNPKNYYYDYDDTIDIIHQVDFMKGIPQHHQQQRYSTNFSHDEHDCKNNDSLNEVLYSPPCKIRLSPPVIHNNNDIDQHTLNTKQKHQYLSLLDRFATVSIQCAYELWLKRNRISNQSNSGIYYFDDILILQLKPFLQVYDSVPMSADLTLLWIQFCCTTNRLYHIAIQYIFTLLNGLLQLQHTFLYNSSIDGVNEHTELFLQEIDIKSPSIQHINNDCNNINIHTQQVGLEFNNTRESDKYDTSLHNLCHNLLNILSLKIIPHMSDLSFVESLVHEIFIITQIHFNNNNNNHHHNKKYNTSTKNNVYSINRLPWSKYSYHDNNQIELNNYDVNTKMKHTRVRSKSMASLQIVRRHMEAIIDCQEGTNVIPLFLIYAIEDCIIDIEDVVIELKNASKLKFDESGNHIRTKLNMDNSSPTGFNRNRVDIDDDDTSTKWSPTNEKKQNVTENNWQSDDRWICIGMAATVALVSYTTWRKRGFIANRSRQGFKTIIAPFKEIIDAVVHSSK